jgi:citrate synthase
MIERGRSAGNADRAISWIDESGELRFRGRPIEELVKESTFLDVAALLWNGRFPTPQERSSILHDVLAAAKLDPITTDTLEGLLRRQPGRDAFSLLCAVVSSLGSFHAFADDRCSPVDQGLALIGQLTTVVAAYARNRAQGPQLEWMQTDTYPRYFLGGLGGCEPVNQEWHALDAVMIAYADHEFSPSTVAARMAIQQDADYRAAIISALSVFSGRKHGGELKATMKMERQIMTSEGSSEPSMIQDMQVIPGFGHSVYVECDPRSTALARVVEVMRVARDHSGLQRLRSFESEVERKFHLRPNVHFSAGLILTLLGIPAEAAEGVIAVSRLAGWTAHIAQEMSLTQHVDAI